MKTKIVLLATVITSSLFWGGCVSMPQTYQIENVEEKNGVCHQKDTGKPVSGTVVRYLRGQLVNEFFVKEGVKHGPYRTWHGEVGVPGHGSPVSRAEFRNHDSVFENGQLVRHKQFWYEPLASRAVSTANHFQMIVAGWNQDGTPAKLSKEKPVKK